MKITKILSQKRNKRRFSIYIDGKYSFSLDYDTLMRENLHQGDEISSEIIDRIQDKDEFARARDYAYNLLSYRDRSELELKLRLSEKGFHQEVVNELINFLKDAQLVDDRKFLNRCLDSMLSSRPMGKLRAVYELSHRLVSNNLVEDVCSRRFNPEIERELARKAANKKMKQFKKYPEETAKVRLKSFLYRRGFDFEIIKEMIGEYFGD